MATHSKATTKSKAPTILKLSGVTAIGLDPGFGNTSVCVAGRVGTIQSAVSIPQQTGMAALGMKSAGRRAKIVAMSNGVQYAVGEGAAAKGTLKTSMDYSALASPERRALMYAAFAEALDGMALADSAEILLAIGLPVPLLQDEQQAQVVLDGLQQLKGEHEFSIGEQTYRLTIAKIKGLAQPAGTYINYAYDDALNPVSGVNKSEVLVLDIGMNTLDIYVLQNGQVLESFVGGDEVGIKRLLELMTTNGRDIMELDALLRHGSLKLEPAQLDGYLGEVLAAIKRTAPNLRRFDVVIPCGGGALMLGDRLKFALLSKGAKVEWPALPIETNVRGFWKYGMLHAK